MKAQLKRLTGFLPTYAKSPTRLYLLLSVVGAATLIVLEGKIFSLHGLSVVGGIVIAIGCLIYTPPRLLLLLAILAAGWLFFSEANPMKDWHKLALLIVVGFCLIIWGVADAVDTLLKRLDGLHKRVHYVGLKMDRIQRTLNRNEERLKPRGSIEDISESLFRPDSDT